MTNPITLPPLSELYGRAWKTSIALWPLFLVRFVFIVLNFLSMIFCLILAMGPFIQPLFNILKNSNPDDYQQALGNFDFSSFFQKPDFLWTVLGLFSLYLVWWFLFEVFFTGALFKQIMEYRQKGTFFSFAGFLKGGVGCFSSMLGLSIFYIFCILLFAAFLILFVIAGAAFFKGLGHPGIGLLLVLPFCVACFFLVLAFVVYFLVAAAFLVKEGEVFQSLARSFQKCVEHYGRVVWSILLIFLAYLIFSITYQTILNLLRHTPLIGLLFLLLELLINLTVATLVWVYFPALSVEFVTEEES